MQFLLSAILSALVFGSPLNQLQLESDPVTSENLDLAWLDNTKTSPNPYWLVKIVVAGKKHGFDWPTVNPEKVDRTEQIKALVSEGIPGPIAKQLWPREKHATGKDVSLWPFDGSDLFNYHCRSSFATCIETTAGIGAGSAGIQYLVSCGCFAGGEFTLGLSCLPALASFGAGAVACLANNCST